MKEKNKYHIYDVAVLIVFYCVFICLAVSFIAGIVYFAKGELELAKVVYRGTLTALMSLPFLVKRIFKITFSRVVNIVYYVYVFLSGFVGVVLEWYKTVPGWDIVIHFLMGAVLAILSIYILNYTIYKKDKSRHNLFFTFLFMIIFALAGCVLWEIGEFVCDLLFDMGYQRYVTYYGITLVGQKALMDTMIDLCFGLLGAISGVLFVYILIQINGRILKTFNIKKLKAKEVEVEDIEE